MDSDRLLYSPEFRRLAGVTQVIPPQDDYVFHDRLTHSLKVTQVASRLAQHLADEGEKRLSMSKAHLAEFVDPAICYVAGLAHDIGHPPFGHVAENELQRLLKHTGGRKGTPLLKESFEGNAQSMRIVASLSFRKDVDEDPPQEGLNLTWRALAAISKYPWLRGSHPAHLAKLEDKWSFYPTEAAILAELEERRYIQVFRGARGQVLAVDRWIEAEIMDWADDISYAVHDIEDFFRSGRIPLNRIGSISLTDSLRSTSDSEMVNLVQYAVRKIKKLEPEIGEIDVEQGLRFLEDQVLIHFPALPFDGTRRAHADVQRFGSAMIGLLLSHTLLQESHKGLELEVTTLARFATEFLKSITQFYLIVNPSLETMQHGQRQIIRTLFSSLFSLTWESHVANRTPESIRKLPVRLAEYATNLMGDKYSAHDSDRERVSRAVVDYLCGLTDRQAVLLHQRLSGAVPATFSSRWLDS